MYDGARVPSPQDGANGFPQQPGEASTVRPKSDQEPEAGEEEEDAVRTEPMPVKKAHREILDHERKRRVELKCMELQEMMEEQGYSEEEVRQKVGTFRQMLMEKEGVITREGQPPVGLLPHSDEEHLNDAILADGYEWQGAYYDGEYSSTKRKSSSSPSPRPKKRKKKKSGRKRSREKRKKSSRRHKRDRSASGSRRKRRYRSGSPKNKHKDKNKQRKRSPADSPSRRSHRRGSCSSRSASLSSTGSLSKSPSRLSVKHRTDGQRSSRSPSPPAATENPTAWQNGHHSHRARNGKEHVYNHVDGEKVQDKLRALVACSPSLQTCPSPQLKEARPHGTLGKSPGGLPPHHHHHLHGPAGDAPHGDDKHQGSGRPTTGSSRKRGGRHRAQRKTSHSPGHSTDSAHSQHNLPTKGKSSHQKKPKGAHSSKQQQHRDRAHRSSSPSPSRNRHTSGRKKSKSRSSLRQRSSSWSSRHSSSPSNSRERATSKASPHARQNTSRDRDSAHHSDSGARRRSRSYSPIRKRRRDSPSFMEARRITSARKRPIPYYRPSPSSSSVLSSHSSSSRSRSFDSFSSSSRSRSRSHSRSRSRSRSRSPSQPHSYYSRSSYGSPGF